MVPSCDGARWLSAYVVPRRSPVSAASAIATGPYSAALFVGDATWNGLSITDTRFFAVSAPAADVQRLAARGVPLRSTSFSPAPGTVIAPASLLPYNQSYAYAMWLYVYGATSSSCSIIRKGLSNDDYYQRNIAVMYQYGQLQVCSASNGGGVYCTSASLPTEQWTHVALIHNSTADCVPQRSRIRDLDDSVPDVQRRIRRATVGRRHLLSGVRVPYRRPALLVRWQPHNFVGDRRLGEYSAVTARL